MDDLNEWRNVREKYREKQVWGKEKEKCGKGKFMNEKRVGK
jgi:hypothetical protein